ncbi:MSHA biogenesis protein MshF [Vibrio tetraodonis]|uniref:MSHA biogenesis protein MshF n=1 Tax=Vibrio tetraodonis TaxID=2231647 RepID=UPI000E0C37E8|nr:MSHA biogenesis protein MshF [Vibrio tetraodonis]
MLSKVDMVISPDRSRLVLWLVVICVLLLTLLTAVEKLQRDMYETAFQLASKRMLERAGFYKQQWMLKGQPDQLEIEGLQIVFSPSGWLLPTNNENTSSCQSWFKLLYPEQRVLDEIPQQIIERFDTGYYDCKYVFAQGRQIRVQLVEGKFSIGIDNGEIKN